MRISWTFETLKLLNFVSPCFSSSFGITQLLLPLSSEFIILPTKSFLSFSSACRFLKSLATFRNDSWCLFILWLILWEESTYKFKKIFIAYIELVCTNTKYLWIIIIFYLGMKYLWRETHCHSLHYYYKLLFHDDSGATDSFDNQDVHSSIHISLHIHPRRNPAFENTTKTRLSCYLNRNNYYHCYNAPWAQEEDDDDLCLNDKVGLAVTHSSRSGRKMSQKWSHVHRLPEGFFFFSETS